MLKFQVWTEMGVPLRYRPQDGKHASCNMNVTILKAHCMLIRWSRGHSELLITWICRFQLDVLHSVQDNVDSLQSFIIK
jgi:hypothetical protein